MDYPDRCSGTSIGAHVTKRRANGGCEPSVSVVVGWAPKGRHECTVPGTRSSLVSRMVYKAMCGLPDDSDLVDWTECASVRQVVIVLTRERVRYRVSSISSAQC